MVYANSSVLSKKITMARMTKSGVGIVTPDFRLGSTHRSMICGGPGCVKRVEKRGGRSFFSESSMSSSSYSAAVLLSRSALLSRPLLMSPSSAVASADAEPCSSPCILRFTRLSKTCLKGMLRARMFVFVFVDSCFS